MTINNKILGILLGAVVIVLFLNNGIISLWDQDEAAYAGFGFNYLRSGDWIIPEYIWSEPHRKTPIHFWNIAIAFKLFGINEFSLRLSSALFTIGTYLIVVLMGRKLFGKQTSVISAIVLGSSLLVSTFGKIALTDGTLLFFTTLCALSMLYVVMYRSFLWVFVFWTSFAFALLTKGPPIIIFTGLMGLMLLIFHEKRKNLILLHPWFFFPLAALPLVYWGYLTYQQDGGEFIRWFIDWYILKRVDGHVFNQTGPPGYHLVMFFVFFSPYLIVVPRAIFKGVSWFRDKKEELVLLGSWFVAGWLFYEFTPSKLPSYSIASHVPLAILIAKELENLKQDDFYEKKFKIALAIHFFINYIIAIAVIAVPYILELPVGNVLLIAGLIMVAGNTINLYSMLRNNADRFRVGALVYAVLFLFLIWGWVVPQIDFLKDSSKRVALYLEENVAPSSKVIIAVQPGKPPSLPFYINQTFDNIETTYDFAYLLRSYEGDKPCAVVLAKKHKEWIETQREGIEFKKISSQMIDRKSIAEYYILYNRASKKE